MSVFLARRAAHAKWSSSCLPTTRPSNNGTGFAYQRLMDNGFISSSGTKQSSSSEPADGTVYVTIEAPTCPDMMKQQPNTDSTTDTEVSTDNTPPPAVAAAASDNSSDSVNGAAASSGLSSLSPEQPLQLIIQLQDDSASTDASQAATIAALTWKVTTLTSKVDTLQGQLSMISTGRVKAISAQFNACRQQAAMQD